MDAEATALVVFSPRSIGVDVDEFVYKSAGIPKIK